MQPTLNQILVFATNVCSDEDLFAVAGGLANCRQIIKWNVDRQDCDHVLRVVADPSLSPKQIVGLVNETGFFCQELPD